MKRKILTILIIKFFSRIKYVNKIEQIYNEQLYIQYKIRFNVQRIRIKRFRFFTLQGFHIEDRNMIIETDNISFSFNFIKALKSWSFIKALKIQMVNASINFQKKNNDATADSSTQKSSDWLFWWGKTCCIAYEKLSTFLFTFDFEELSITNLKISRANRSLKVHSFILYRQTFCMEIELTFKSIQNTFIAKGNIDRQIKSVIVNSLIPKEKKENCAFQFSFENISAHLKELQHDAGNNYICSLITDIINLTIDNDTLCPEPILIKSVSLEIYINFNRHSFTVKDESCGMIDQIPFSFYIGFKGTESQVLKFVFLIEVEPELLKSIFRVFQSSIIKSTNTTGNILIQFVLMFAVDDPYEYFFDIQVPENTLVFNDCGKKNLSYLNSPFSHNIYKNGSFLRDMLLDERGGAFCKIEDIAHELIRIIVYAEDPNFYNHIGVDIFFIGYAIVTNLATKKMKRGASTITMQLARNLFLDHKKNFVRKLEETAIALLIENEAGISKNRILEIYLNIIEFGPNVYGIAEATKYYFNKAPAYLTTVECIILTYIIPRPIHFHEALITKSSLLATNLNRHLQQMANKLQVLNIISHEEFKKIGQTIERCEDLFTLFQNESIKGY
ncbi:biosynthetic peptidoglycan transglycosylase [Chitinophagaceae bacterium LWZ2-11]